MHWLTGLTFTLAVVAWAGGLGVEAERAGHRWHFAGQRSVHFIRDDRPLLSAAVPNRVPSQSLQHITALPRAADHPQHIHTRTAQTALLVTYWVYDARLLNAICPTNILVRVRVSKQKGGRFNWMVVIYEKKKKKSCYLTYNFQIIHFRCDCVFL